MFGYIYMTTNLINGKKYIGQRKMKKGVLDPLEDNYLGSGTLLLRSLLKYGKENFSKKILQLCDNYDELNKAEKYWIAKYDAVNNNNFYNIATGGEAGDTWTGRSEEKKEAFREKIRQSNKTRIRNPFNICNMKNPAYGKKWYNDGVKNYLLEPNEENDKKYTRGMIRTEEHNKKIGLALKGKKKNSNNLSTLGRKCYNNGVKNIFLKPEDIKYYENNGWVKGMINARWDKNKKK